MDKVENYAFIKKILHKMFAIYKIAYCFMGPGIADCAKREDGIYPE
jgi:hypothetical protein